MRRLVLALLAVLLTAAIIAPPASALPAREIAGVQLHPWTMDGPGEVDRTFGDLAAIGVRWARVDFRWHLVEPWGPAVAEGRGDWSEMDAIAAAAERHGIRLLPIVAFSPHWASSSGEHWALPASEPFEDFFAAALRRYPRVTAWELWNEPNYGLFAKPTPDPVAYVEFLRSAHRARARVGSTAKLVSGGLAPGAEIDIVPWVDEMARLGGLDLIDGLGVHPYSAQAPDHPSAWMMRLEDLHNRLVFAGHGDLKLWLTEYGSPVGTVPTGWGPAALSEEQQAHWMRLAFATATQLPFVENLNWFEYRDSCVDPARADCHFGLLRRDGSVRLAYHALREIVTETSRLQPSLSVSLSTPRVTSGELRIARGGETIRASRRYVFLKGSLALPGSPSADTPMAVRVLRGGAVPRLLNLTVRNGAFRVRLGRPERRPWKVEILYAGSSVYAPAAATLRVPASRTTGPDGASIGRLRGAPRRPAAGPIPR